MLKKFHKYKNSTILKRIESGVLSAAIITSSATSPYAMASQGANEPNPYIQTIQDSKPTMEKLNYFFESALRERRVHLTDSYLTGDINENNFKASSYLLNAPTDEIEFNDTVQCNLNDKLYASIQLGNPYPHKDTKNNSMFKPNEKNSYCLLQKTFSNINNVTPSFLFNENTSTDYNNSINNLKSNDTLVVVVPGIFGEFIDQVAFGEVFGQGLAKVENDIKGTTNVKSNFENKFLAQVENLKSKKSTLVQDERLILKNLNASQLDTNEFDKDGYPNLAYEAIDMTKWIKVSSFERNSESLFKIAILGLEPMSLESIGPQKRLAEIYLRRLDKFLKVYKMINNNKLPEQIIFIGYSRGTPVANEMLALLNNTENKEYKNFNWKNNIKAMLSLGGVSLGSSLADASVVIRENKPDRVTFLQAFKDLMYSLQIITPKDIQQYNTKREDDLSTRASSDIKRGKVSYSPSSTTLEQTPSLVKKLSENIMNLVRFELKIKNLKLDGVNSELQKLAEKSLKSLIPLYTIIQSNNPNGNNTEFIASKVINEIFSGNSLFASDLNSSIANALLAIPSLLFPGFLKASELSSDNSNGITDSRTTVDPTREETREFNNRILQNFGLKIPSKTNDSTASNNISNLSNEEKLKALNDQFYRFQTFFKAAWEGGFELGTLSRLSWLAQNGSYLPTESVKYYSISAILADEKSNFYNEGIGLGYNVSSDQSFLNPSRTNITKVGDNDGLNGTFAGTSWNDSQVDWHKTVLWPHIYKAFTNKDIDSKVLALIRTHHWGLALPFAALNSTDVDPNTGIELSKLSSKNGVSQVDNVNPFPRKEFLLAALLTINSEIQTSQSQGEH